MRISDEERRRVAKKLREAASAKGKRSGSMEMMLSKLLGIAKQDKGVFGQEVDVSATWRDVYKSLADLIDRETCRNVSAYQNRFECSECGFEMPIWDGDGGWMAFYFCPNCGAEVVDE